MPKQKGREYLIKISNGDSPETFATLCGLVTKGITINNNTYDVTTPDCTTPGGILWRELQEGMKSVTLTGNGLVEGSDAEAALVTLAMAPSPQDNFQVIWPGVGTFEGAFLLSTQEGGGEMEGGVSYGLTLESTGAVTFTAA